MRSCLHAVVAIAGLAGLIGLAGTARAQGQDAELRASELFDLGQEREEAGDWTGACLAYDESQRLAPAVATQLNLAQCRDHEGRLLEAAAILRAAIAAAQSKGDRVRGDLAQVELAAVVSRTPRIAFDVAAGVRAAATIDGAAVADLDVATPVDPGRHEIVAQIDGAVVVRRTVTLGQSAIERIRVGPETGGAAPRGDRAGPDADPTARAVDPRRDDGASAPNRHRTLVLATGVGALALAAAGSYLMVSAYQLDDESYALCEELAACSEADRAEAIDLTDRAISRQQLATGVLIGAGVVGGVAAVLWWTGRPRRTAVDVAATPGGAAVLVRGAF